MLGISGVLKISEVNVGHTLVRLVHYAHTDVTILFVLTVQGVTHHIVAGLGVEAADAEHLVARAFRRWSTARGAAHRRRSSSVPHHLVLT